LALQEAESLYLPRASSAPTAIVLAASRGEELGELTADRPKTMIRIGNQPLLGHIVAAYNAAGIHRIVVVSGYRQETVRLPGITCVANPLYASTGELFSLCKALESIPNDEDIIVSYGDVLFRKYIVGLLRDVEAPLVVAVDTNWQESANRARLADYVHCSEAFSRSSTHHRVDLKQMDAQMPRTEIHGEWIGFLRIGKACLPQIRVIAAELVRTAPDTKLPHLINELIKQGQEVRVVYTTGNWLDIDSFQDVVDAVAFQ
jgi:phosphoenolpyruvate phosphomutase